MTSGSPATIGVVQLPARAVVSLNGLVADESVVQLVDTIDRLHQQEFYREVTLRLASPGGTLEALSYLLEALDGWQAQGLRITTRALTPCCSAAAIVLALGDLRLASRTSRLVYHNAQFRQIAQLDRVDAQAFWARLERTDDTIIQKIAGRAVRNPIQDLEFDADDQMTLLHLCRMLGEPTDQEPARWLQDWLASSNQTESRVELYDLLFRLNRPVSGTLAYALGLIDRLVGPSEPETVEVPAGSKQSIRVPEWKLAYPDGRIDLNFLRRHTMVLGETGSGKTRSAVLPVLAGAYRSKAVGVGLVIDPKHELADVLSRLGNGKQLVDLKAEKFGLNLMDSPGWSVTELIQNRQFWSAAELILKRVGGLVDNNPAGALVGQPIRGNGDPYWWKAALRLYQTCLALAIEFLNRPDVFRELASLDPDQSDPDPADCTDMEWLEVVRLFEQIGTRIGLSGSGSVPNVLVVADLILNELCGPLAYRSVEVVSVQKDRRHETPMQSVGRKWLLRTDGPEFHRIGSTLKQYSDIRTANGGGNGHYTGVYGYAALISGEFSSPEVRDVLYFGCEPTDRIGAPILQFSQAIGRKRPSGIFWLYRPDNTGADNLIAKALKAAFFESVIGCKRRQGRQADSMPLVAYVADEFQRFVTADRTHGEQSFLDVCRSFGVFAVLACQSIASLEYALASIEPDYAKRKSAIDIIFNNTATKMFFRSTDPDTIVRLDRIFPRSGSRPVTDRRPLSSLAPGECYAVWPDGRAGRIQIDQFQEEPA